LILALATASAAAPRPLSLPEALELAVAFSPQIKEEQFGVLIRESQRRQANAARFAQLDVTVVGGPSPRARGNQISSPDSKGSPDITGVFGRGTFSIIQPIYTFGKINSFRKAAAHGIAVSKAQVQQRATEVALLIYESYYGYQLATALEDLAREIGSQLRATLEKVQRQIDAQAPGVDNIDLFKLQTFESELNRQMNNIRQGKALAITALHTLTNIPYDTPIEVADPTLQPAAEDINGLETYLNDAQRLRPEFIQAREGEKAYQALLKAAKADFYPFFFAGIVGGLAEATNRESFTNPFVFDSLHDDFVTPIIGLRWHYDLGITAGKVDEAEAQLGQIQQKHALAEMGIPFQVRQAYLEMEQHRANIEVTRQGFRDGRKWLVAALSNFDLGLGEGKDVADAVLAYARLRASYFEAIHSYNLALIKLDHAAGRDVVMVRDWLPAHIPLALPKP
jgi:outer membrane protein TolC